MVDIRYLHLLTQYCIYTMIPSSIHVYIYIYMSIAGTKVSSTLPLSWDVDITILIQIIASDSILAYIYPNGYNVSLWFIYPILAYLQFLLLINNNTIIGKYIRPVLSTYNSACHYEYLSFNRWQILEKLSANEKYWIASKSINWSLGMYLFLCHSNL